MSDKFRSSKTRVAGTSAIHWNNRVAEPVEYDHEGNRLSREYVGEQIALDYVLPIKLVYPESDAQEARRLQREIDKPTRQRRNAQRRHAMKSVKGGVQAALANLHAAKRDGRQVITVNLDGSVTR